MATADYKVCKHFYMLALKQSFIKTTDRMLYTNFYQNQPSFVEDMTKTFWPYFFLGHGVYSCVHYETCYCVMSVSAAEDQKSVSTEQQQLRRRL